MEFDVVNDSKRGSFPINNENMQRTAETMTRLGRAYREGAEAAARQAGIALAKMTRRGVEWTAR